MINLSEKHLVILAAVTFGLIVYWLIASDTQPSPVAVDQMASLAATASTLQEPLMPR